MKEKAIETWGLDSLVPYGNNAKLHSPAQVSKIARSIAAQGLVNIPHIEPDGTIITGHGRTLAMKELGWKETRVFVRYDLTKAQAAALRLADNKVSEGGYDTNLVQEELRWLEKEDLDLGDLGFDDRELAFLTEDIGALDVELLAAEESLSLDTLGGENATDNTIAKADSGRVPVAKAIGFKDLSTSGAKTLAKFMAVIAEQEGVSAEQAFIKHCEGFLNG